MWGLAQGRSWGERVGIEQADVEPSPDGHPLTRREEDAEWTRQCGGLNQVPGHKSKYMHSCLLVMSSARDAKSTYDTLTLLYLGESGAFRHGQNFRILPPFEGVDCGSR